MNKRKENVRSLPISLTVVALFLSGCFLPSSKLKSAFTRTDKIKNAIVEERRNELSIAQEFTYAADVALRLDPAPTKYSMLASEMTQRSILASGVPPAEDASRLKSMVKNLVSTNEADLSVGNKTLSAIETKLASVQRRAEGLEAQLTQAQEKEREVSRKNAELADRMVKITRFIWFLVALVVIIGLGWVATIILPFLFPAVGPALGTMKRLVSGIQSYRHSTDPNASLDDILLKKLDESDKWRIQQIKRKIGAV